MAATKRKSSDTDVDTPYNENVQTPTGSPARKRLQITRNQKKALIDNLQLEITERARRLRAQYALQAGDLRARIERRINRVPVGLRKARMGDLLEKHAAAALRAQQQTMAASKKPISPSKSRNITMVSIDYATNRSLARRTRKLSREGLYSDKENVPTARRPGEVLNNPKKRSKPGAAAGPSRVVSEEKGADYKILSPKSSNSRTYPHSPFHASPEKSRNPSYLSHPLSPLKPSSPLKAATGSVTGDNVRPQTTKTGRSASNRPPSQAKRTASRTASRTTAPSRAIRSPLSRPPTRQHERRGSTGTVSSTTSSGTAVVRPVRAATSTRKGTPASSSAAVMAAKKTTTSRNQASSVAAKRTTAAAARKPATPVAAENPSAGRRTLRRRV